LHFVEKYAKRSGGKSAAHSLSVTNIDFCQTTAGSKNNQAPSQFFKNPPFFLWRTYCSNATATFENGSSRVSCMEYDDRGLTEGALQSAALLPRNSLAGANYSPSTSQACCGQASQANIRSWNTPRTYQWDYTPLHALQTPNELHPDYKSARAKLAQTYSLISISLLTNDGQIFKEHLVVVLVLQIYRLRQNHDPD
jgi:hypothetical protein